MMNLPRTGCPGTLALALCLSGAALPSQSTGLRQFEERVVAGGNPGDFLEVRHLVLRGSQRAIGKKLAEVARDRCGGKPWRATDPFDVRIQREYYRDVWPQHFARMEGAAAAFATTVEDPKHNFAKVAFNTGDYFGCSVVFYPGGTTADGRSVLSRNLDFTTGTMTGRRPGDGQAAAMSNPFVIESYPDSGYASLYVGTMDLLGSAFDGINEKGLTAALLTDRELIARYQMQPRKDLSVGFSEIQLIRYLLETCATVEEAKAAILRAKHYYAFVPCHFIVGDRGGDAFVWEAAPSRNRDWFLEKPGEPLVTTNFMLHLHEDPMKVDPKGKGQSSVALYQYICRTLDGLEDKVDTARIKSIARAVQPRGPAPPPRVPYAPNRTLWHALYYPDSSAMEVDFYLRETPTERGRGMPKIERSDYLKFALTVSPAKKQ